EGEPGQLVLLETNGSGGSAVVSAPKLPPLVEVPEPPLYRARSLSYSALALFESCSYRYYAERVVGMREAQASGTVPGHEGLAATESGDSVHVLLEALDLQDPRPPGQQELAEAVFARYPAATESDLERIVGLVRAYCDSELAERVSTLEGAAPERPFAFEHDGVLLHGRLDVLHLDGPRAIVVDYKTTVLEDASPEEVIERDYHLQRLVYAIACFRAGANEVEVVYQFLERPDPAVTTSFVRAELPGLEAELSEAIARIQAGVFKPTPSEFICSGCPALDVVCAGPRLRQPPETPLTAFAAGQRPPRAPELGPRGAAPRRPEAGADPADHPASQGRVPGREDRSSLRERSRAARLGHALGADDRRERQPRHGAALQEVQAPGGLPRRPGGGTRAGHLRDRLLSTESKSAAWDNDDAVTGLRRARASSARRPLEAARSRAEDGERRLGRARRPAGHRRRHPCAEVVAASGPHQAGGPGQDRARSSAARAAGRLGQLPASADHARPPDLHRARPALRRLRRQRPLPFQPGLVRLSRRGVFGASSGDCPPELPAPDRC